MRRGLIGMTALLISLSGAVACDDDVAQGFLDTASSIRCPGYGSGLESPSVSIYREQCMAQVYRLYQDAKKVACGTVPELPPEYHDVVRPGDMILPSGKIIHPDQCAWSIQTTHGPRCMKEIR